MSIDMSQFYQVFFEESAEHLASMESLLLELDLDAPDPDQLNAIFRSAHSIKGGSGTFGFTDMTEVTHVLETLLDRIRKNEIAITADMVDAFLVAGDVLHGLLDAHQNGTIADLTASKEIRARLEGLTTKGSPQSGGAPSGVPLASTTKGSPQSGGVPPAGSALPETVVAAQQHLFQITFVNSPQIFPDESQLKNLLEDLANIGKIENQQIVADSVSLELTTWQSAQELADIFSFFLAPEQLTITTMGDGNPVKEVPAGGTSGGSPVLRTDPSAEDLGYGFFDEIEPVNSAEDLGYGFFDEPEQYVVPAGGTPGVSPPYNGDPSVVPAGGTPDVSPPYSGDPSVVPAGGTPGVSPPHSGDPSVEDAQGYGFFVEPEKIKSDAEDAQGYGFFVEVEAPKSEAAPVDAALDAPPVPQRRAADKAPAAAAETSIRVSVEKVDQMINLVGELVITQSMLAETASHLDPVMHERLINGLAQLERNTRELQESVMSVRMMPINFVFSRFPRLVRDLAGKLDKKVQLKLVGEGTELDKGLIEKISDPLTHLVRNSLDHGVELPEERIAKGKDPQGTITLRAAHQGGNIIIEVSDDGAGLNRERILAKAREKGLPVSDNMSDADVWSLIFAPGFSTAAVVTDVSGRGVGMDVVKKNIEGIGGRVEISSRHGQGSTITIRLPLTLAILDGLSIAVGDQIYIVPLSFISESLQPAACDIRGVSGQGQVVHVRGEYLPLIALHEVFNIKPRVTDPAQGILVLLEAEGKKVALFVDDLVGQHQVVIKSLETNYRKVVGVSGATIMGDGRVAMIMDVSALVKLAQG
ncbi:MAG: chemotaxis protein CheW [Gallionella sp.]